jgi:hypothetical protein
LHTFGRVRSSNTSTSGTGAASGVFELGDSSNGIWRGDANSVTTAGNFTNIGGFDGIVFSSSNSSIGSQTERMRITSGGNVLVGTTTANVNLNGLQVNNTSGTNFISINTSTSGIAMRFYTGTSIQAGYILVDGSSTSYVTSSDYRLKEDLQEIKGLEKVSALKVYDFKWKDSENRMDGVLAHELAEVIPCAVHGEKDAVDEEGNEIMQGVDYSKIVPVLIKAIQELKTEIDSLKTK